MVQACRMAECPTTTSSPSTTPWLSAKWMTVLSWMLERAPMTMVLMSARRTELYQMETSSPKVTRPATWAPGAIHAPFASTGT